MLIQEKTKPGVAFYTHWHGSELPALVEEALLTPRAQNRLDDPDYLCRIIFEEIIDAVGERGTETGWGICSQLDPSEPIVGVELNNGEYEIKLIGY